MTNLSTHRTSMWDDFGRDPKGRIELFERAAAMADAGKLSAEDGETLLREYRERISRTQTPSQSSPNGRQGEGALSGVTAVICATILAGSAFGYMQMMSRTAWIVFGIVAVIAITATTAFELLRGRFRMRRLRGHIEITSKLGHFEECLAKRVCPDCGYSLKDVPARITVIPENGLALGPRACPECGTRWPLVPSG